MGNTLTMLMIVPAAVVALVASPAAPSGGGDCPKDWSVRACEYAGSPAEHGRPSVRERRHVLRFLDVRVKDPVTLDVGTPGASPGDTIFFDNALRNASNTRRVGSFASRCTQVSDALYHCQGTLLLAHGKIDLATTTGFGGDSISASVVGGVGRYRGVRGEATIKPTSAAGVSSLVVQLSSGR